MDDTDLLLEDFKAEAKAHIEKIESSFLNATELSTDIKLINSVFRAAHSLKGTASLFSLKKIVAVAHELESVFSHVKDESLIIDGEITDIVLQSVDCLKDLVANLRADDAIDTENLIAALMKYSSIEKPKEANPEARIPFDCAKPEIAEALSGAIRHGHKIYYMRIGFNRSLGKYYKNPNGMLENILSIGSVVGAIIDDSPICASVDSDPAALTGEIIKSLAERDTSSLELLVTSVLDIELFSIAVEIDLKHIYLLPNDVVSQSKKISEDDNKLPLPPESAAEKFEPEPQARKPKPEKQHIYEKVPKTREKRHSLLLDVSAINSLMDLSNEMILTRNQLLSNLSGNKKIIDGLSPILHNLSRLTSEIQEKVMFTRMQPLSLIFGKFPRIIRDTAKALNKDIQIEIFGDDVMLDKYLLDSLSDPITQLVKNSADHGIETAEQRAMLGKPRNGKVILNAYLRDGSAIIEVTDDGAGIDLENLKRKSFENGIATEEMLSSMSRADAFDLMFEPGISTAKQVTSISGRGIGMDIVKANVEKLGGLIEIISEKNKGTTVRLKMPLTLSVIRTLIIEIDSIRYAVPETNLDRIVRCADGSSARRLEKINESLFLSINGRVIPIVTIKEIEARVLHGREWNSKQWNATNPHSLILSNGQITGNRQNGLNKFLVLKAGEKNLALMIDDAIEIVETFIKPLPMYLQNCAIYSNVTILGDGSAITILDAEAIMRLMGAEAVEKSSSEDVIKEEKKQIVIFKCSGTEYFALEISEISRIEVVYPDNIQEIGDELFINIAEKTIHIIRPEDFAPVKKLDYSQKKLCLITLKKSTSPTGLLAGRIIDKVEDEFLLDEACLYSDFIFGSSVYNEKILIFLNPAAINKEVEKVKMRNKTLFKNL